jgi:hypothetical protein
VPRATDMLSAPLAGQFYRGPLRWGFIKCAGCHILPYVGYPGILILDKIFTEVHLLPSKLLLVVAMHPLVGSQANRLSRVEPSVGAANRTQDGDPPSHELH